MAPKKLPRSKLKRSARNYRDNPLSRKKKAAYDTKRGKLKINRKSRAEHNKARRRLGIYGKGGPVLSRTKRGKLVREDPQKNRARNRGRK